MGLFSRKKKKQPAPPAQTAEPTVLICTNNKNTVDDLVPELEREHFVIKGILWESAEVVERYQAVRPDFVMLDNDLNGQDGLETLRALYEADPEALVVFLSAFFEDTAQEMLTKALAYGADQILAKNREGNVPAGNIRSCLEKVAATVKQKKGA